MRRSWSLLKKKIHCNKHSAFCFSFIFYNSETVPTLVLSPSIPTFFFSPYTKPSSKNRVWCGFFVTDRFTVVHYIHPADAPLHRQAKGNPHTCYKNNWELVYLVCFYALIHVPSGQCKAAHGICLIILQYAYLPWICPDLILKIWLALISMRFGLTFRAKPAQTKPRYIRLISNEKSYTWKAWGPHFY